MPFAKKSLGQNFLRCQHTIDKIVRSIHPTDTDSLLEIGPGLGAITQHIIRQVKYLHVVEKDARMLPGLQQLQQQFPQLNIHHQDILKFELTQVLTTATPLRIIGNLPYNISTPILFYLLPHFAQIQDCHFMLQKEVVDRIVAAPGSKSYGRLSVMLQYHCQPQALFDIAPGAFNPAPKVTSSFLRLRPHQDIPHPVNDLSFFEQVVKQAFSQRRKTLHNALKPLLLHCPTEQLDIDLSVRAEQLSVQAFVNLSNQLQTLR